MSLGKRLIPVEECIWNISQINKEITEISQHELVGVEKSVCVCVCYFG